MSAAERFWAKLREHVFTPQVSDEQVADLLARARDQLPPPVIWLFGKAQSGKTSLIRALTGSTRAEIGSGFRPCTRTASKYAFPDEAHPFVEFLDTRGLGEVAYDPADDLARFAGEAHLLLVVVKATDHALAPLVEPLRQIRRAKPAWPAIVAQTCLHEAYPPGQGHVLPYPWNASTEPPPAEGDLARTLAAQRQQLGWLEATFVPLDFTLPEDGLAPEFYGLEALWSALEVALPRGLRAMLADQAGVRETLRDVYFQRAHAHVMSYAAAAGLAAGIPVPLVDVPLVLGVQAKMFHTLASLYGQELSPARFAEVAGTLGMGFLARLGGRELLKFIPGFGSTVAALYAAASTYALGRTLCAYFSYARAGDLPDPEVLRQLYAEQFEAGRRRLATLLKPGAPTPEARP